MVAVRSVALTRSNGHALSLSNVFAARRGLERILASVGRAPAHPSAARRDGRIAPVAVLLHVEGRARVEHVTAATGDLIRRARPVDEVGSLSHRRCAPRVVPDELLHGHLVHRRAADHEPAEREREASAEPPQHPRAATPSPVAHVVVLDGNSATPVPVRPRRYRGRPQRRVARTVGISISWCPHPVRR